MKNIWSAGFRISKIKSAGFVYTKMHFGMQATDPFFGSLQASDSKNQRKKVVCRLRHPPWYTLLCTYLNIIISDMGVVWIGEFAKAIPI